MQIDYIIKEAVKGGFSIHSVRTSDWDNSVTETFEAVASDKAAVADFFRPRETSDFFRPRDTCTPPDPTLMADAIVLCHSGTADEVRVINMIKAMRTATRLGLKEAKDAIEAALRRRGLR